MHGALSTPGRDCPLCPRLQTFRDNLRTLHPDWFNAPVPAFGQPTARLLIVGLAPGMQGANRTGRPFTGDGIGGSSDFLLAAMHASGFANKPVSRHVADGLELRDAFIAAAVRCAPPDNKPTPEEFARCQTHLVAEWDALPNVSAVLCLGKLAWETCWRVLATRGNRVPRPRPIFAHAARVRLDNGFVVLGAYHPSRQNTHTGRLTPRMLADAFALARKAIDE